MPARDWCDHRKTHNNNKKRDDKKNADGPLADLPEWLTEFKENLENTELHASTHSSQESDPEHPTKVATKSRKHSIYAHFPKDRNFEVCLRTKMKGLFAEDAPAKFFFFLTR